MDRPDRARRLRHLSPFILAKIAAGIDLAAPGAAPPPRRSGDPLPTESVSFNFDKL